MNMKIQKQIEQTVTNGRGYEGKSSNLNYLCFEIQEELARQNITAQDRQLIDTLDLASKEFMRRFDPVVLSRRYAIESARKYAVAAV